MSLDEQRTRDLLRSLDDPEYLEFPRGYHHVAARTRFNITVTISNFGDLAVVTLGNPEP